MIKQVVNFLDNHRLLLVFLILCLIVLLFIGINSYIFLHHEFQALNCTENIDDEYCYHHDIKIFANPENSKTEFFTHNEEIIHELQEQYHLDDFNYYTAYYYLVASKLHYTTDQEYKILWDFFEIYANTYNLEEYYLENNFYFNLFYKYKIY